MLIYSTLAGSRLYGYNKPDSDYDYRGVFLAPKSQLLGLETLQDTQGGIVGDIDSMNYELRKFANLALKGNPNILEILFSTKAVLSSEYWDRINLVKYDFLSERLRAPYSGFLLSEIRKLEKAYEPKAAANAWRLAFQAIEILSTGNFNPTLDEGYAGVMKDIREGRLESNVVMTVIRELDKTLQTVKTILPEKPNTALISDMIIGIYEDYYHVTRESNTEW